MSDALKQAREAQDKAACQSLKFKAAQAKPAGDQ